MVMAVVKKKQQILYLQNKGKLDTDVTMCSAEAFRSLLTELLIFLIFPNHFLEGIRNP
jgi:hypothetical protein